MTVSVVSECFERKRCGEGRGNTSDSAIFCTFIRSFIVIDIIHIIRYLHCVRSIIIEYDHLTFNSLFPNRCVQCLRYVRITRNFRYVCVNVTFRCTWNFFAKLTTVNEFEWFDQYQRDVAANRIKKSHLPS